MRLGQLYPLVGHGWGSIFQHLQEKIIASSRNLSKGVIENTDHKALYNTLFFYKNIEYPGNPSEVS